MSSDRLLTSTSSISHGLFMIAVPQDVLFGRGFTIGAHSGNRHLRDVVRAQKPAFVAARKKEKRIIAMQIVEEIQNLDPPGRFLIEVSNQEGSEDDGGGEIEIFDRAWIIVETEKAVDKVMHRLREREKVATGIQDPKVPSHLSECFLHFCYGFLF